MIPVPQQGAAVHGKPHPAHRWRSEPALHPQFVRGRTRPSRRGSGLIIAVYVAGVAGLLNLPVIGPRGLVVLEIGMFSTLFAISVAMPRHAWRSIALALAYFVLKATWMVANHATADFLDFIQAYKSLIYLLPLGVLIGQRTFSVQQVGRASRFLIYSALARYSVERLLLEDHRPTLIVENNYEITLLAALFVLGNPLPSRRRDLLFLALLATGLIGDSRSGLVSILVVYVCCYFRPSKRISPAPFFGVAAMLVAVVAVFLNRQLGGLEALDRYRFLTIFWHETSSWPLLQWFTGAPPLTPLTSASCSQLSGYTALFSRAGDGTCFSVVLHSYVLRVIFDHGLIGIGLIVFVVRAGVQRSAASTRQKVAVLALVAVNSVSVSGLNNVFCAASLGLLFALRTTEPRSLERHAMSIEEPAGVNVRRRGSVADQDESE